MEYNFTGSSRPQRKINLGGSQGASAAQVAAEARVRRAQRSQEREYIAAARRIEAAYLKFATARAAQAHHAQVFDALACSDDSILTPEATRELLLSCRSSGAVDDAQTRRLGAWASAALSASSLDRNDPTWHYLVQLTVRNLIQQMADHPTAIPQPLATTWLTLFERLTPTFTEHLVRSRLYDALIAHTLSLPCLRTASAGTAASLAVGCVKILEISDASVVPDGSRSESGTLALHGLVKWLAIPGLTGRLPIPALALLAASFPLDHISTHVAALGAYFDASSGDSVLPNNPIHGALLENIVRLAGARVPHLTSSQLVRYITMLTTLVNASGGHSAIDTTHLTSLLTASRRHPSSLPQICELILALLSSGSDRESVLTTTLFTGDGASGQSGQIVRELWRGWVRSSVVARNIGTTRGSAGADSALRALRMHAPVEWSMLTILCELYSRALVTLGDDEFYPEGSRNPLSIDDVLTLSAHLRNLAFAMYWYSVEGKLPGTHLDLMDLRSLVTRLLQQLHTRDSRRQFAPSCHWHMLDAREIPLLLKAAAADEDANGMDIDEDTRPRGFNKPSLNVLEMIPFVVPFEVRVEIFRQYVQRDAAKLGFTDPFAPLRAHSATVRRNNVASDGMYQLGALGPRLKEPVKVTFVDEFGQEDAGIDGGGVFKEFLTSLVREAFDTDRGLWCSNAAQELYPNPHSYARGEEQLSWFAFLGRIIGKALYEGILVNAQFARFFLSKWLGQQSYLDDLASLDSLDPALYRGLLYLKNYGGDVEADLALNFTVSDDEFGVSHTTELIPGGIDIPVTRENRLSYIYLVTRYRLWRQIEPQSAAFFRGLAEIIDPRWLRMFDPEELRVLVSGADSDIDIADLRANTVYGGYHEKDPAVQYFWESLESLDTKSRRAFLRFVTSSPNPPLLGFGELNPKFAIRHAGNDTSRLPTASTCINLLKLPDYKSRDQCLEKLRYAIDSAAGFYLS